MHKGEVQAEMIIEDYGHKKILIYMTMEEAGELFRHVDMSTDCWHRTQGPLPHGTDQTDKKEDVV